MRSEAFNQGQDTSLDWVGCWALELIQGMTDRGIAYQTLVDFTFSGDGALHHIATLARREPLPNWIPPDVGGYYPSFPSGRRRSLANSKRITFSLARLAQETGMRQNYLDRLTEAHLKKSSGRRCRPCNRLDGV